MRRSIQHLVRAGIQLDVAEAVAIASTAAAELSRRRPPVEFVPTPADLLLHADGRLDVIAAHPASRDGVVADLARMLMTLLPPRDHAATRAPSGLIYTIARSLRTVEAPPLDTLDEFSRCLARIATRPARDVLRDLAARAGMRRSPPLPALTAAAAGLLALLPIATMSDRPWGESRVAVTLGGGVRPVVVSSTPVEPGAPVRPSPKTRASGLEARPARRVPPHAGGLPPAAVGSPAAVTANGGTDRPATAASVEPLPKEAVIVRFGRLLAGDGQHRPRPFPTAD